MKYIYISILCCLFTIQLFAQIPDSTRSFPKQINRQGINNGHLYGKVIDSKNNKAIEAASVQLISTKYNAVTQTKKDTLLAGMLTESNGDFSLENLPIFGKFKLSITAIGYKPYSSNVSFNIDVNNKDDIQKMLNNIDKDLGNIKLDIEAQNLGDVVVTSTKPLFQMGIDRKIFNVDKNLISTGQTATEIMKNIPSINVDIDGNVTLRGSAPQLFVDGRPTTLSLDQIPADAIESVELITNPSAKFDASGSNAGILNIVLKKNKQIGFNGNARLNLDSRGRFGGGGDINVKQGKWNVFATMMYRPRKSMGEGYALRKDILSTPNINTTQNNDNLSRGYFGFGRFGFDYFLNNRNTFTLSQGIVQGKNSSYDNLDLTIDSLSNTPVQETGYRNSINKINFSNYTTVLAFKHLFPQAGHELTADATIQIRNFDNNAIYTSQYYLQNGAPKGNVTNQNLAVTGGNKQIVIQTDYAHPINKQSKIEVGLRVYAQQVHNDNKNYINNIYIDALSNNYTYNEQVYAGYITYANKIKTFSYQLGLRAESSVYDAELTNNGMKFNNKYPISLFPSIALTKSITNKQDLQLNFARRINRPNFFQLSPYIDYSDTLNLIRGNPNLKPEFTNNVELSYSNSFNKNNTLIATLFYKYSIDLITRNQEKITDPTDNTKDIIINTYINANSSQSYGLELTSKNTITSWLDVLPNINIYNASINSSNAGNINISKWSWFGKLNTTFKIPGNWSIQVSGDYHSQTVLPQSSGGGGRFGGSGPFSNFGGVTAQGYIKPNYGVDMAIKKEFLSNKALSITLSISDIFKTRKYALFSETPFFIQDLWRRRDAQVVQLSASYRFGKINTSLFKRKNTKANNNENVQDLGL